MNPFLYQLSAAGALVIWIAVMWVTTGLFKLQGPMEWVVRSLLSGLGFGLYAWVMWRFSGREKRKGAAPAEGGAVAPAEGVEETDFIIRDAEAHLAASRLGKEAKLGSLPLIFVIGESGSAKTSAVAHSGMEPELVAGQVYHANTIVPTRAGNIWFARNTIFAEAGGKLLYDVSRWLRFVKRLQPKRWRSLFARDGAPHRAAVVCIDSDEFLKQGAADKLPVMARNLHARLSEISHLLGSNLPVYALFTRSDRVQYFTEFANNLTDEETRQVLGATLPIPALSRQGVYAEEQSARLNTLFDELFFSLCDKRPELLSREHDQDQLGAVYQFAREFRKLRESMVQFLVDLCRPSQLRTAPFLRGFYFSGIRPVMVKEEPVAIGAANPAAAARPKDDATGILFFKEEPQSPFVEAHESGPRRIPEWIFLHRFFDDVLLRDDAALGATGASTRTDVLRHVLLGLVMASCAVALVGTTTSYFRNRALVTQASELNRAIIAGTVAGQDPASVDNLRRLESLRQLVETLSRYSREGPPFGMRWGLYAGDRLYPPVRASYFNRFHGALFGSTQAGLLEWLRRLPAAPSPNDAYTPTYDTLKGYLITTSHHEKSTRLFLSPLLMERWVGGRNIDPERLQLARRQFDFYSDELKLANPFSSENDGEAIARARHYLAMFGAVDRIYQAMLAEASRRNPSVSFNRQFAGSAQIILSNYEVPGAFSRDGWLFMQDAIRHADRFFGGEEWVLGPQTIAALDRTKLEAELWTRYRSDYLEKWRDYLKNSAVLRYASLDDAARKLNQISGTQSYLLGLFCLASSHIAAAADDAKQPFQPVQYVTPPGCSDRYIGNANSGYMQALVSLQSSIETVSKTPRVPNDPGVAQTLADAANAKKVTRLVAQNFRIDREGRVEQMVQKLMEDPITNAEALLGNLGPAQLNAEGRRFCGQFLQLTNKYPFNSSSKVDATIQELNAILRLRDGLLWTFYETNLKSYIVENGGEYTAKPNSGVRITPAFLTFFNRAARFASALYKDGAKDPKLTFSMRALPAQGIQSLSLTLDGQTLKATAKAGEKKEFTWPGATSHDARLSGSLGGPEFGFVTYDGLWAAFRFFGDADRFQPSGSGYNLEWVPRQGQSSQPMTLSNGKPLTLPFYLDLGGAPPVFQKGYLSGFQCVSTVAQ